MYHFYTARGWKIWHSDCQDLLMLKQLFSYARSGCRRRAATGRGSASSPISTWSCRRFPGCDEASAALATAWLQDEGVGPVEVLKEGRVWAIGEVVIKTSKPHRLRRSAAAWERLAPVHTPEPLLLASKRGRSVLFMRRCHGVPLNRAWHRPETRDALADLIASLIGRGIIYGDLRSQNLLWDGRRLSLIDLESLRPGLHGLLWRRHLVRTWAALHRRLPDHVRAAHDRCCVELGIMDLDQHWAAVMRLGQTQGSGSGSATRDGQRLLAR